MSDLKFPTFLSKSFFQNILQNELNFNNNIQVDDVKISLGSEIGENYTSVIYRAKVLYHQDLLDSKPEQKAFIVKSLLLTENAAVLHESNAFEKEIKMYKYIMPKIEELYKNIETFAPKYYYVVDQPDNKSIILQDLVESGYVLADRIKRLDEAHSKVALRKLGRYHAGTLVLSKEEPHIIQYFDKGFMTVSSYHSKTFQNLFVKSCYQITEFVSQWEGFEKIAEKMKNMEKNLEYKIKNVLTPKPNEIRVLNHSDFWTNNMLFYYSENGNVSDINFIDLQVSTNGSIAMDINYFLNTSIKYEIVEEKREELVKHYYAAFKEGLQELNYSSIPSLEDVQNEVKSKEFYGFLTVIGLSPVIALDRDVSKDSDLDTFMDNDALSKKRAHMYKSEIFGNFLKYSIKRFDSLGLFD